MNPLPDDPAPQPAPSDYAASERERKRRCELTAAAMVLLACVLDCRERLPVKIRMAREFVLDIGGRIK